MLLKIPLDEDGFRIIEPGENPFANFHAARIQDPDQYDEFANVDNSNDNFKDLPDGIEVILGIKGGESEVQAYRFAKDKFTVEEAKAWLKKNKVKYILFEPAREEGENSTGAEASKADAATFVDHGDYASFYTIFASEGIFVSGDGEPGWRSPEEVRKMVPLCNGMRVVVNHPSVDAAALTCTDLNDEKHPVIGWTSDAKPVKTAGIQKVGGWTNIWKKRNGVDAAPVIAKLKSEELGDVSIGYFFARVPQEGTANGQKYGHLEQDVNPYHLAILDGFEPACPQPICGVGCASRQIPLTEDEDMEGNKNDKGGTTPQDNHAPASTPPTECVNCKAHAENQAKTLAAENQSLKTKVQELEKAAEGLNAKVKEGDEAKAKLNDIKAVERKAKLDQLQKLLGEEKFKANFPEDAKGISDEEIARTIKLLENAVDEEEADASEAPPETQPETAAAKPAANSALKAPAGKTVPASPGKNEDDGFLPPMYEPPRRPGKA